ncbi:MAG: DUF86 domain-containing protein [Bacteroidales bacterium]|nr:DUF86 domain-containing protein [Bacteroidales bacterium]
MEKDDLVYIEHILDCIRKIKEFTNGLSLKDFSVNELVQDAVIRNIEIIGEASKKISSDTKQIFYEIPWREIAGMRDKLIHDYLGSAGHRAQVLRSGFCKHQGVQIPLLIFCYLCLCFYLFIWIFRK